MGRVVITVTIDTDGDARVSVGAPVSAAQTEGPLDEAPWPDSVPAQKPQASGVCPVHHVPWKTVPAGFSTTKNKAYDAFQACPERGCNEKPW